MECVNRDISGQQKMKSMHDNWLEEKCVRVCRHDPTIKWERLEEEEENHNSFILVINDRIKATVTDYEYLLTYDGIRNIL